MKLTGKQKKFIKKNINLLSASQMAVKLGVDENLIIRFVKNRWGNQKSPNKLPFQKPSLFKLPDNFSLGKFIDQNKFRLIFLVAVTMLVYLNSLPNDFVSDDVGMFTAGGDIEKSNYLTSSAVSIAKNLVNWIVFQFFQNSSIAFRSINIFLHVGSVVGLFILLSLTTSSLVALFTSLIVAVHPIFTESVVWISAGNYVQYSFLFIWSLVFYFLSTKINDHKKSVNLYLMSLTIFIASLLTSEKSIVLWISFIVFEYVFGNLKTNWKKILPFFVISLVWSMLIFFYFPYVQTRIEASHVLAEKRIYNPLVQIPVAISNYINLVVFPVNLSLYHPITSLTVPSFIIHILVFMGFMVLLVLSFIKNKTVFFWLSIFIISLLPTFSPIIISWVVAERYVYLGSIGLITAVAIIVFKYAEKFLDKRWIYTILVIPVLLFSLRTFFRNLDWRNYETLYTATVKTAPTDPRARNNMGDVYMRRGEFDKALNEFNIALNLRPKYAGTQYNIGLLRYKQNKMDEAIKNLNLSLEYDPKFLLSYQLLSSIYYESKNYRKAIEIMSKLTQIDSQNSLLYFNLGNAYFQLGDKQNARKAFQKTLQLDPNNPYAKNLLNQITQPQSF